MNIPIVATPEYETTLPSGNRVKFRPFLVKEEKVLLMIKDSNDFEQVLNAMLKVVDSCLITKVDVKTLSYADIEHLFIIMRSRSVGETIDVNVTCKSCGESFPANINVNLITTTGEYPKDLKVMLSENIGVTVQPIPIRNMATVQKVADDHPIEVLYYVIDSVFNDQDLAKFSEYSSEDKIAFVESLSLIQVQKILKKVEEFPKCCIKTTLECPHCGEQQEVVIEGIDNFFT